jgi:hypothetical protein
MISKQEIEKPRSPRGLRQFVTRRVKKIREIKDERHKAIKKRGIYKVFSDEIVPLSIFCLKHYPNTYVVEPVLGNQAYDAIVMNDQGQVVDYVELTLIYYGVLAAENARLVVSRSYGQTNVYAPGENLTRMFSFYLNQCQKKSLKDYTDCSLVFILDFVPPRSEHRQEYLSHINQLIEEIRRISFKANKVYLLVKPFKRVFDVNG